MKRLLLLALLGGVALAACEGAPDRLRDRSTAPEANGGGAETDPELEALAAKVTAGPPMMRNVSNREYLAIVSDLIGEPLSPELQKTWTATTQFSGFDAVPWTNLDTKAVRDRADTLEIILDRAVQSPKVMTCTATSPDAVLYTACAKRVVEAFATRAFGRPLRAAEAGSLAKAYDRGANLAKTIFTEPAEIFVEGVRAALGSVLLAPQLLTRVEAPPSPDFTGERALDAYELAHRLSFMFLGSIPDDELWARAEDGSLVEDGVLLAQAERLLDTKTDTFVKAFMGQWFDFRALDGSAPDSLEHAMFTESWRTLADVVREDLPLTALLEPGFTYVNQDLAAHYGIPGQFPDFQRVTIADRGGVLQQASWLTTSATPLKTSPIHRGRLVQDRLLCKVIPPPDSALFEQIQAVTESIPETATVKERVEMHRNAGPACKGCHEYMDPIGIGLEAYDQHGKLRTTYADTGMKVETDSTILGRPFATPSELVHLVTTLPEYRRCVAEKVSVFSLRRVVDAGGPGDAALLAYLTHGPEDRPPTLRAMVLRLVASKAFRTVNHGARS